MKKNKASCLLFVSLLFFLFACDKLKDIEPSKAGWIKVYQTNGSGGYGQQTSDGGFIITGEEGYRVCLLKTDKDGNEEWFKRFEPGRSGNGKSVHQTIDGGYIIGASAWDSGDCDFYIIKTDSSGDEAWSRMFGGDSWDECSSLQETTDGGYIISGRYRYPGSYYGDVYLIKIDSTGNEQWIKKFGGSADEGGNSVQQTKEGGYIIAGHTSSFGTSTSMYVYFLKTDSDGNKVWDNIFGGVDNDLGQSVQQTPDEGYIIAGHTKSFGAGKEDIYLIKTDSDGKEEWSKTFGGSEQDIGWSMQLTSDGGYIIVGWTKSFGAGGEDVYLIKTDSGGNEEWSKTFGGSKRDEGMSVQQTSDGGYLIIGWTISDEIGYGILIIKTDSNGNID